jgi:hypothetical protein
VQNNKLKSTGQFDFDCILPGTDGHEKVLHLIPHNAKTTEDDASNNNTLREEETKP